MSTQVVRQRSIAIAREDDATKGTAAAASTGHFVACDSGILTREIEQVKDMSGVGRIEVGHRHFVTRQWSGLKFSSVAKTDWLGHVLTGLLGAVSSANAAGETGVREHTITVSNAPEMPAYTFFMLDSLDPVKATYGTFKKLTLKATAGGVLTAEVEALARKCVAGTGTPAYNADYYLLGAHGAPKIAADLSSLAGATAIGFHEMELVIERDAEPLYTFGSDTPNRFIGGPLRVSGKLKLLKEGTTYVDLMTGATDKAFRFDFTDTATTIGNAEKPGLVIDLAKIYLSALQRPEGMDDPDYETFDLSANYDLAESSPQMIRAVLTNTQTATAYTEPA